MEQMKTIVFCLLISVSIISGCSADSDNEELTYADFEKSLVKNMSYEDVIARFGEPDNDMGSGIHIPVYVLDDSTQVVIGCTDEILYARHLDKDGDLLHTLIGEGV